MPSSRSAPRSSEPLAFDGNMSDRTPQFQGFYVPNSTQVPDTLFDELMADLSGAELKVVLYVIRRTFGFKRRATPSQSTSCSTASRRRTGKCSTVAPDWQNRHCSAPSGASPIELSFFPHDSMTKRVALKRRNTVSTLRHSNSRRRKRPLVTKCYQAPLVTKWYKGCHKMLPTPW